MTLPTEKSNTDIINQRRMINGKDDGLMQVHPLKHPLSMEISLTVRSYRLEFKKKI